MLLLGGVVRDLTEEPAAFVSEPELFDPATNTFIRLAVEGPALRRYEHTTLALTDRGRTYLYAYGGLEYADSQVRPTGTLVVFELVDNSGSPTLVTRSPAGGIGTLVPTFAHALAPLTDTNDTQRVLAVGTDVTGAARVPYAQRLGFRLSSTFAPFEITTEAFTPPSSALGQFTATAYGHGLTVLSGGGVLPESSTAAPASDRLQVFAEAPTQFFDFAESTRLSMPRARHTATLLADGRILLLGGVGDSPATPLATTEILGPR